MTSRWDYSTKRVKHGLFIYSELNNLISLAKVYHKEENTTLIFNSAKKNKSKDAKTNG